MPVLRTSASDFTAWSRANAILPANGKAAKSTDTTVDRKAAAVVAIGSQSAIGATPSSAIAKRWRIVPAVPAVKATLTNSNTNNSNDSFIVKYDSAGTVQWAAQQAGTGSEQANGVAVDSSGNVIVTGYFSSATLTLYNAGGGGTTTLTAAGTLPFVVKYNSAGTVLWAAKQGGTGNEYANGVAVDSSGNVIVTGYFSSNPFNIYNAGGGGTTTLSSTAGSYDSFIAKYNSAGTVLWAAKQAGTDNEYANGVAVDSSGNIIVGGSFTPTSTTLTFYNANGTPFATTLTNSGNYDSFIVKYDSAGTVQWVAQQSGTGSEQVNGVAVDSSGNIIAAGHFNSATLTLYNAGGGVGTTLTNSGSDDSFVVKYNSAGTVLWAAKQAGTDNEYANGVAVDSSGNVIVVGYFNSNPFNIYNAGGGGTTTLSSTAGSYDSFIAKYNSAGTVLWAAKQAGTSNERGNAVTVDSSGNIIVTGYFPSTTLTFYNANGTPFATTLTNSGSNDSFIVKYDSAGTVLWAAKQSGTGSDIGKCITADSTGNIIVGGLFASTTLTCYNSDGTDIITPEIPPSIAYYR